MHNRSAWKYKYSEYLWLFIWMKNLKCLQQINTPLKWYYHSDGPYGFSVFTYIQQWAPSLEPFSGEPWQKRCIGLTRHVWWEVQLRAAHPTQASPLLYLRRCFLKKFPSFPAQDQNLSPKVCVAGNKLCKIPWENCQQEEQLLFSRSVFHLLKSHPPANSTELPQNFSCLMGKVRSAPQYPTSKQEISLNNTHH